MNPEPRRYQARITGFDYGIVTDGKGRETSQGWNMEWAWLGTDLWISTVAMSLAGSKGKL
ncbi:hypothetical protein [Paraburkholderia youngii]|uniref:hypothetical protein n=1 Tax=Paraburkholderia youngii TaxID=2782701 RepID=UPI003D220399